MMQKDTYKQNWQSARARAEQSGLTIVEIGWEQHVIIDKSAGIVYRYPRHYSAAAKLDDEVAVLRDIHKQKWPTKLPIMIEHTPAFTSYEYIPGEVLTPDRVSSLKKESLKQIGQQLGEFLALFHQLDSSVVLQKKTRHSTSLLEYYENRIHGAKTSEHKTKGLATLSELSGKAGKVEPVVVHGDLHGPNVVINPETKQLTGVIDLSEMEIGDPHQEFRKIYMTFPDSLDSALQSYHSSGGQEIDKRAVILWAYANEWANVCYFADDTTNLTYKRAHKHLKNWGLL